MNRAMARRMAFETRADSRFLTSLVAREVRAGTLEVHDFCLLGTHVHLLESDPEDSNRVAELAKRALRPTGWGNAES